MSYFPHLPQAESLLWGLPSRNKQKRMTTKECGREKKKKKYPIKINYKKEIKVFKNSMAMTGEEIRKAIKVEILTL